MKNYVVGIYSAFDYENKLFKVEADNEVEAMKQALLDYTKEEYKQDQIDWNRTIGNSVQEIQHNCFEGDLIITKPLEI